MFVFANISRYDHGFLVDYLTLYALHGLYSLSFVWI